MLRDVPKPCGTPLIWRSEDREPLKGLTIWPDHMARRMDVKRWLAEEIVDYGVMRVVLGLEPRSATQPRRRSNSRRRRRYRGMSPKKGDGRGIVSDSSNGAVLHASVKDVFRFGILS